MRKLGLMMLAGAAVYAQKIAVDLPKPYATPSSRNAPRVVAKPETAKLNLPPGFAIEDYATGFNRPRFMLLGPGGELLLTERLSRVR